MTQEYTPSQYLKQALERDLQDLSVESADYFIERLRKKHVACLDTNCFFITIGAEPYIPKKYLGYAQQVYATAFARALFERSSKKISYAERFKLAQKIK